MRKLDDANSESDLRGRVERKVAQGTGNLLQAVQSVRKTEIVQLPSIAGRVQGSAETNPGEYSNTPEGDLRLNTLVEIVREDIINQLKSDESIDCDWVEFGSKTAGRTAPYDTAFSLEVDNSGYVHRVAEKAGLVMGDENIWPLLVENRLASHAGRANVDFRLLELRGLLPENPLVQDFIRREGLRTDVSPHEMMAAFVAHSSLEEYYDETYSGDCPNLVAMSVRREDGATDKESWLTINTNNEDATHQLTVDPRRENGRPPVGDNIRLLTVKERKPIS